MVALVGRSGSGKSLLLSLAPRLSDPMEGCVCLDGVNVRELALEDLRRAVCLVTEDTMLFRRTIAFNIGLGRPEASRTEIEHAARVAQAHRFIVEMPEGFESVVGDRGSGLRLRGQSWSDRPSCCWTMRHRLWIRQRMRRSGAVWSMEARGGHCW